MCVNVSTLYVVWKVFIVKTEMLLYCSEKCAEMAQPLSVVFKAFIEKTETKFSEKSPL